MRWRLRQSRMDVREIVTCDGVCVEAEWMCVRSVHFTSCKHDLCCPWRANRCIRLHFKDRPR